MKYLFMYAFMFRRIDDNKNTHVQISGIKFNTNFKQHVARKLALDEKIANKKMDIDLNKVSYLKFFVRYT